MGLTDCPACKRRISEAASSCPGCGHPIAPPPNDEAKAESIHRKARPGWIIFWTAGGFVLGILLNAATEVAAIALGGPWDGYPGPRWVYSLTPYVVALGAGVLSWALSRRPRDKTGKYSSLAIIFAVLGLAAYSATSGISSSSGVDPVEDEPVAGASATTTVPPTTTTTSATAWATDPNDCRLPPRPSGPVCDGYTELYDLVFTDYWRTKWLPLWKKVRDQFDAGDVERARITCEVARSEHEWYSGRLDAWRTSTTPALHAVSVSWFDEMAVALAACADGAWDVVNESRELVSGWLHEACDATSRCSGIADPDND